MSRPLRGRLASYVILVVFALAFFITCMAGGISDLSADPAPKEIAFKGDVIEYDAYYAQEVWIISHKLFGFIPTRKEYFYLTASEDGAEQYLVLASKRWFEDNFDSDGLARGDDVHITALLRRTALKNGLYTGEINDWLSAIDVSINENLYADINYKTVGVLKIAAAVLTLVVAALIITILRFAALGILNSAGGKALIAGLFVTVLALVVIIVGFL